ncbi:hypothetical protein Agub_g11533 [Astrephomene gubernaculifera]|uniref:Nudix hydrolase domain-containing protein n=1 Tax=Astrephomene gubernaculifera TaxID=47775 RepID=A0AAD3DYC6_9CHLO|nr:hypothetical protein Agub_g11533 [Astrephomene gubernaculifera]
MNSTTAASADLVASGALGADGGSGATGTADVGSAGGTATLTASGGVGGLSGGGSGSTSGSGGGGSGNGIGFAAGSGGIVTEWPPPQERLASVVERLRARPQVECPPVSSRSAAVLVGLFEDGLGVVRVLLTQRSSRLKSHTGEVCLPGGKRDDTDANDVATALREAEEELGIDPARVTVLGSMPPVLSKHHLSVTPVMALVPPDLVPTPSPHEVEAAFTIPLAVFLGRLSDPRVTNGDAVLTTAVSDAAIGMVRRTRRRTVEDPTAASAAATRAAAVAATSNFTLSATGMPLVWRSVAENSAGCAPGVTGGVLGGAGGPANKAAVPIGEDKVYGSAVHTFRDVNWNEHMYRIHSFEYGGFNVWGLTATICIAAAQLALGRTPGFQELCPNGKPYSAFFWDGSEVRIRPCGEAGQLSSAAVKH